MNPETLQKIQKILALTRESVNPTEGERNAAMSAAARILGQHGLTVAEFSTTSEASVDPKIEHIVEDSAWEYEKQGAKESADWFLLRGVCVLCDCQTIQARHDPRTGHMFIIAGCETDVAIARSLMECLVASRETALCRATAYMRGNTITYRNSFRLGFAQAVKERALAIKAAQLGPLPEALPPSESTTREIVALRAITNKKNNEVGKFAQRLKKERNIRIVSRSSNCRLHDGGKSAGRQAGSQVHLGTRKMIGG